MPHLIANPEDRFSHIVAHIIVYLILDLLPTADDTVKEGNVLRVIDEYLLLYEAC